MLMAAVRGGGLNHIKFVRGGYMLYSYIVMLFCGQVARNNFVFIESCRCVCVSRCGCVFV